MFAKEEQVKKETFDESDDESAISRTESELREVTKVNCETPSAVSGLALILRRVFSLLSQKVAPVLISAYRWLSYDLNGEC